MTDRVNISERCAAALEMMAYWASSEVPKERPERWLSVMSEVASCWAMASAEDQYLRLRQGLDALGVSGQRSMLARLNERYGVEGARATFTVMEAVLASSQREGLSPLLNEQLAQLGGECVERPQLTEEQRLFGGAFIQRALSEKADEAIKPGRGSKLNGYMALPLIGAALNERERISFVSLMIDALAELHEQRLEPTQGFAPERLLITYRFELWAPRSKPTQLTPLFSPEVQRGEPRDYTADVWTITRLLLSVLTGKPLAASPVRLISGLPTDVAAPLKRALHPKAEERFYSGRELRVVLSAPLKKWLIQLAYEAQLQERPPEVEGEQRLDEELLSYEDFSEQERREEEKRVQRRRAEELRLRHKLRRRMRGRQLFWLVVLGGIGVGAYYGLQSQRSAQNEALQQQVKSAERSRLDFDESDREYLRDLPKGLEELDFRWRSFKETQIMTSGAAVAPFLASVSEVTIAQYQQCVTAGSCAPTDNDTKCRAMKDLSPQAPMTCVTFKEANEFAGYVGGQLPNREHWSAMVHSESRAGYPWGEESPTPLHANLRYSDHIAPTALTPVCSAPLGDSTRGMCDLIGNVHEWVVMSYELNDAEDDSYGVPREVGLIGGGWLSSPNYRPAGVTVVPRMMRGEDLGFRVIKDL